MKVRRCALLGLPENVEQSSGETKSFPECVERSRITRERTPLGFQIEVFLCASTAISTVPNMKLFR
jgi:hypothetical protein